MRINRILSVAIGLLAVCVFAAAQAGNAELRKQVEAVYAKWNRLMAKKDLDGLWAMIDPSFVGVDEDGNRATGTEVRKQFEAMLAQTHDVKSTIKVDQVQGNNDEVVAWVTATLA